MQIRFCLCESNLRVAVTDRQTLLFCIYFVKAIFGCTKRESSTRAFISNAD